MKADHERLGRRVPNLDLPIRCHSKGCTDWFYVVPSDAGSLIVWFHNTTSLMRSPRLKGPIATLDLRHFPLIEGVVVEDWSNSPRLFRVLVSEHDEGLLRF